MRGGVLDLQGQLLLEQLKDTLHSSADIVHLSDDDGVSVVQSQKRAQQTRTLVEDVVPVPIHLHQVHEGVDR